MQAMRTRVTEGGRIVIPAEFRKALGLCAGDPVILFLDDGEVRIFTPDEGIRRAQKLVREHATEGPSPVDELIAERHAEAERD